MRIGGPEDDWKGLSQTFYFSLLRLSPLFMHIKTLLDNLHEEVSCSVCRTTFTDLKQLPCLHSSVFAAWTGFYERVAAMISLHDQNVKESRSRVPSSANLNDLPTNFNFASALFQMCWPSKSVELRIQVWNVEIATKRASTVCTVSSVSSSFLCDDCLTAHNKIRAIKDFLDQDIEDVLKRPTICEKPAPEDKELEYFCYL